MKYLVSINEYGPETRANLRVVRRVSLAKARKVVRRAARRGVKLYGGEVSNQNWGAVGGQFPAEYRSAVIHLETEDRATALRPFNRAPQ